MGSGMYSSAKADDILRTRKLTGSTFDYDRVTRSSGMYKAHESLDPKKINNEGLNIRESRDSEEHPNSVPIAVFFDETGSMGSVPRVAQEKLSKLFGLLLQKGYVEDPQILVGAYGDAYCDRVPLQVSQFESDNRIDENLNNLFLEGGGGGNNGETISLAWYYLAHHTSTDSFEKRNKKGYAFFIADERALDLKAEHINKYIGDSQPLGGLTAKEIAKDISEKWNVVMLVIDNYSAKAQKSIQQYEEFFGKTNVLVLEDSDKMTETIGLIIGVEEGTIDSLGQAKKDLEDVGMDVAIVDNLKNQLNMKDTKKDIMTNIPDLNL